MKEQDKINDKLHYKGKSSKKLKEKKDAEIVIPMMEIHQYVKLFFEDIPDNIKFTNDDLFREESCKSFYRGLINLFTIRKTDFNTKLHIDRFLENFSVSIDGTLNHNFKDIGNFNILNARPIIKLDEERYFIFYSFLLYEAVYESPFYWMIEDKTYRDISSLNRGKVGEEITFNFLSKVFGEERTFQSVKIVTKKGFDDTDIDILCILGSKALCVQVKSKKLTELSRSGNYEQIQKDFKGAVQDAYEQGLKSRKKILDRNSKFFDKNGNEIFLSEAIDEVYIMGITTENYPSLTHQVNVLLEKEEYDPYPIFLSVFDLELVTHYLNDSYDFLYYVKQRVSLMDYYRADEEIVYLGYHLNRKLWKKNNTDFGVMDTSFGQLVDRNYYPYKLGLEIPDDGDKIKTKWKNEDFEYLLDKLKTSNEPKITDIIFHLLDFSEETREDLINYIIKIKNQSLSDGEFHNFSLPPDPHYSPKVGITYVSIGTNNPEELKIKLNGLCEIRKYRCKADIWIDLGSLIDSKDIFDVLLYDNSEWVYNEKLENLAKEVLDGNNRGQLVHLRNKKIGRNDKCPCGSGEKFKKCCGNLYNK